MNLNLNSTSANNAFVAPMNGTVIELLVEPGNPVQAGQAIVILEAMKMQHTMCAPSHGTVKEFFCKQGDLVDGGSSLLAFEAAE